MISGVVPGKGKGKMKRAGFVVGFVGAMLLGILGAFAQESVVLKELVLPEQTPGLIDWFLASKAVSVVKYASIITMAVQILKMAAVLFGGKLPAKLTPAVAALMGLLVLWETATADGQINGGDWSALIVAMLATLGAFFGYKVLFSTKAAVNNQ